MPANLHGHSNGTSHSGSNGHVTNNNITVPQITTLHANGNGTITHQLVENPFEFYEKKPSDKCCFGKVNLQKGAGLVGGLSLVSVLLNALLIFMGMGRLGLNIYFEVIVLLTDLLTVICLLRGLHKRKAGLLRPFILFNIVWYFGLIVLFAWCTIRMAKGTDLSRPFLAQLGREPRPPTPPTRPFNSLGTPPTDDHSGYKWLAFLLLLALALLIFVGCAFINVIYRTLRLFAYEEEKESNRLTPPV